MQKFYADAFFCKPPVVLNVQLLPCSLGHLYFLKAIESRFMAGGDIDIKELITAVWICSRPFLQGVAEWQSGNVFSIAREIGERMGKPEFLKELATFTDYLSTYIESAPSLATKVGKVCPVPWPMLIASRLMSVYGMTEEQAWNTPANRAQAYNASWRWDNLGDDSLLTEDEINLGQYVKSLIEKEKAANG